MKLSIYIDGVTIVYIGVPFCGLESIELELHYNLFSWCFLEYKFGIPKYIIIICNSMFVRALLKKALLLY